MASDDEHLHAYTAIRGGDVERLRVLLAAHPDLPSWMLGPPGRERRPLHLVTDWPGYFPNGPAVAELLIAAGADVDWRGPDGTGETPLHWTASSDDADVARVLIDAGADIEAPAGSIGTPLDNAVGYGCWNVAGLLVERGAVVDKPWQAAALGLLDRLRELLDADPPQELIDQALWHACAGGQRRAAELLVDRGADLAVSPEYAHGTVVDAASMHGTQRSNVIEWLEGLGIRRSDA
ncbi:ankyrin repeat domain-containing protein [Microbacterium sp. ASV49]|uniref:Ankyrin repeat domain-containing protein n=1 Tax=Microbacterium candidum TaxID=3041922 RepID=A0ABT7MU23_9MICO|nr:ankyrin repeat domain-containing protein [Microbacterium sp. ASV49]MDL9977944.1 ankyrin repeat domain-containing protein [Microbacterium sp. ASV49]